MIDARFVLLGAALSMIGTARYSWQTIKGRTKPNRVTWFLWATAPIIGFFAQLDDGVGLPSILTLSVGVGPAIVFASSFVNPSSYWRISRFDLLCGTVSVLALIVWLTLDDPTLAVAFAVLADLMAGVPTLRKAWAAPGTENAWVFSLSGLNGVITLLTIDRWTLSTYAFPAYIAVIGTVLTSVVVLRTRSAEVVGPAH